MKLASIAVIMFGKRFWSSFRSKPSHLRLENPFYDVESTFKQFNFNLRMIICISSLFVTLISSKKTHFIDSEHFHGRGLHFQQLNV